MSIRTALRSATWTTHQRLVKRLNVAQRFSHPQAYRTHLERMWGFCAALELRIDAELLTDALDDYPRRRKLPLLSRDLAVLGLRTELIERLPHCQHLPECSTTAAAFGSLYVMEGATLGGRALAPLVRDRLGFSGSHGAAFLTSYGEDTAGMWQRFVFALEAWCCNAERNSHATDAASATFTALEHWLCGAPE